MANEEVDIVDLAERARRIAEDTGRDEQDILADLMDDGVLNMSHIQKESRLLRGMDTAEEAAKRLKSLLGTLIPVLLMLTAAGAEMFGVIDFTDAGLYDDDDVGPDPIVPLAVYGCMDTTADNYDPQATTNDSSCSYPPPPPPRQGCTDPAAENHDPQAEEDDGSCTYGQTEPACEPNFAFYSVTYEWQNDNDTLAIMWDADSTCEEEFTIEIDVYVRNGSEEVFGTTVQQSVRGSESDWKQVVVQNLNSKYAHTVSLGIWHDHGTEGGGWKHHDEKDIQTEPTD